MVETQSKKVLLSLISIAVGMLLFYQAYIEQDEALLLVYWAVGLAAIGAGLVLLLYRPAQQKKTEPPPEVRIPEECPSCGASLATAGKFCGSCGAPLTVQEVEGQ
ncbi:hypothetical protein [Candidatus Pyrohabitans sp.]